VLIKPNLLTDRAPEEAVTTHPEVVRAIIRAVRACGGNPSVADSPASAAKLEQVWEKTGFRALCEAEGVPLLNLERAGSTPFTVGDISFHVAKPVMEADVLISVPKVKTHTLTSLTAAVKNLYGTLPGYQKAQLHMAFPRPADFGRMLRAIHSKVRPALNIADGIVGMEGEGPAAGTPVALGFLAASRDAEAMDLALCGLLGISPAAVPYLDAARARELPPLPDTIARPLRFRVPSTLGARLIPAPLVRLLGGLIWIRPGISEKACIQCGRCVKACPVGALSLEAGWRVPRLAPAKCIGCCCCHEICPEKAIAMMQSPVVRLLRKGKPLSD
jgi:uncharacterized protein (DUF362 family)/Pyruvate/2-oxoacid:ferredoxin oxidoreductase delta subunit